MIPFFKASIYSSSLTTGCLLFLMVSVNCNAQSYVFSAPEEIINAGGMHKAVVSYNQCSNVQKDIINNVLIHAAFKAQHASEVLTPTVNGQYDYLDYYKTWFGELSDFRYYTVSANVEKISDLLTNKQLDFDCTCAAKNSSVIFAYVYPDQPYKVHLCDAFWSEAEYGLDLKAAALIHELSHFNTVARTYDRTHGEDDAKILALDFPVIALDNAENYEFFIMNAPGLPLGEPIGSGKENVQVHPKKGLWWNSKKSGSGFDLEFSTDKLSVIWYTYDQDGLPTWYLASAPYSDHSWKAYIKQFSWNGQSAASTDVGVMEITFSDDSQAKLSWALDGFSGDEDISYLSFANTSSDNGYSGIWYQPANPGSGVTLVDQGSVTSTVLYFYDAEGKPRWALSNASGSGKSSPGDYSYQLETYMGGACPYCTHSTPSSVPVGEMVMDLTRANNGRLYTDITLKAPLSGSWKIDNSVIENLAP